MPDASHKSPGDLIWSGLRRLHRPVADLIFALLLTALVLLSGWLIARHDRSWDLSLAGRNSLTQESLAVLARLEAPLNIRVFAAPGTPLARSIEQVLQRYHRVSDRVRIEFVDPQRFPELARAADVRLQGQLVLEYRDRRISLSLLSERVLTNAIARLQLQDPPWVAVLEGHGERAIDGGSGSDIGRLAQLLSQRGFRVQPLDLARQSRVPDNTDALLITTPVVSLFPGEAQALTDYVARGGNLLWLLDPPDDDGLKGLEPLLDAIGLALLPGQLVDATAGDLRLSAPTFAVVEHWPRHPLAQDLNRPAIFPGATPLKLLQPSGWTTELRLSTGALSWNETGPVRGEVSREPELGEEKGPLDLALLLTRPLRGAPGYMPDTAQTDAGDDPQPRSQRIAVLGDGDFLANAHLDEGANKPLALQLMRWVTHRDDLISIPPPPSDRVTLMLTPLRQMLLTVGFLAMLPGTLMVAGLGIQWFRARG